MVGIGGIIHQSFDKTSTKTVRLGLVGTDSEPVWDNVQLSQPTARHLTLVQALWVH